MAAVGTPQRILDLVEEAKKEITRAGERGASMEGIVSSLRARLFDIGASVNKISSAVSEIQMFIREQRVQEALRQYSLAQTSDWPGPHLNKMAELLGRTGIALTDLGISEERIRELREKARQAEARFQYKKLVRVIEAAARDIEGLVAALPPTVAQNLLGDPSPEQLLNTLNALFNKAVVSPS